MIRVFIVRKHGLTGLIMFFLTGLWRAEYLAYFFIFPFSLQLFGLFGNGHPLFHPCKKVYSPDCSWVIYSKIYLFLIISQVMFCFLSWLPLSNLWLIKKLIFYPFADSENLVPICATDCRSSNPLWLFW